MEIKCLAQGSSGNCWVLTSNGEKLIIDAGIPIKQIVKGIDYDLMSVSGVICSHVHTDHSKSLDDLEKYGLEIFRPYESIGKLQRKYGSFDIKAFSVEHDGTPCYGFLISVEGKKLIYVTDFEMCKYTFLTSKVNSLVVECNYQLKYVDMESHNVKHKLLGHCELSTCKKFISDAIYTDALSCVLLTHLGAETCDGEEIVDEVKKTLPRSVYVAYSIPGANYVLGD